MIFIEAGIILALCILSAFILPRFTIANRFGVTAILCCCIFLIGVFSFVAMDVWFKTIYMILSLVVIYIVFSVKDLILRERYHGWTSKESIETNRMLGLSLQSQGLLDLAFEKFRKCPLDDTMKDVVYNLGLDYERKRMVNKAIAIYEYITQADPDFRDLKDRIPKLQKLLTPMTSSAFRGKKETNIAISNELEIKPTIGRYEILGELGQGAMGIVYKARDPKINRLLAIKTIRFSDEFEDDRIKEVKERFFREAEIAGKLSHPNIVSIYDVGEDYDLTYLAMEYLEGESLHKYCQKGALLPLRIVLSIMVKTAAALEHAHRQGVIHRDIKPANIMFLKNGKVKVTDFGIAKAVSTSQTKSGIVLGTPSYMSPEQINGKEIDGRSDIFSLGVVFFELLTGQAPFKGKSITNLFYEITQGRHPSPKDLNPKIPRPCIQIIDKALSKNPEKRFQKAGELAKYLDTLVHKIDESRLKKRAL